jgi:uncharacterized protein YjiS (DUF1127 family)
MSNRLLSGEHARLRPRQLFARSRMPFWAVFRPAWRRYRSRQRIAALDCHLLKDIGVSFTEAEFEANKPFWRA